MRTLCKTNRAEKAKVETTSLWKRGALVLLWVAYAQTALQAEPIPNWCRNSNMIFSGVLLAPHAQLKENSPLARLLTESDPQVYGGVVQWRDPQSGAVLRTLPLAARPDFSGFGSAPVSTALAPQGDILANVGPQNILFWQNSWSGAVLRQFPRQNYPLAFSPGAKSSRRSSLPLTMNRGFLS